MAYCPFDIVNCQPKFIRMLFLYHVTVAGSVLAETSDFGPFDAVSSGHDFLPHSGMS